MLIIDVTAHKGNKLHCSFNTALPTFGTVSHMSHHLDVILGHDQLIDFFFLLLFFCQLYTSEVNGLLFRFLGGLFRCLWLWSLFPLYLASILITLWAKCIIQIEEDFVLLLSQEGRELFEKLKLEQSKMNSLSELFPLYLASILMTR